MLAPSATRKWSFLLLRDREPLRAWAGLVPEGEATPWYPGPSLMSLTRVSYFTNKMPAMRVTPGNPCHLGGLWPRRGIWLQFPQEEALIGLGWTEHRAGSPPAPDSGSQGSCDGISQGMGESAETGRAICIQGSSAVLQGIWWNWPRPRRSCKKSWKVISSRGSSGGLVVAEFGNGPGF